MARSASMLILAGLFVAIGCEKDPADRTPGTVTLGDVRRDTDQAAKTVAEYSQQTKEEFQQKLEARLNEMEADMVKAREKGRNLKDEAKASWDQKLARLETKRDEARAKLSEVRSSSAEAWKDIQKGVQSSWDVLDRAFRDAWQELF